MRLIPINWNYQTLQSESDTTTEPPVVENNHNHAQERSNCGKGGCTTDFSMVGIKAHTEYEKPHIPTPDVQFTLPMVDGGINGNVHLQVKPESIFPPETPTYVSPPTKGIKAHTEYEKPHIPTPDVQFTLPMVDGGINGNVHPQVKPELIFPPETPTYVSPPTKIIERVSSGNDFESAGLGAGGAFIIFLIALIFRWIMRRQRRHQRRYDVTTVKKLDDAELVSFDEPQLSFPPPPLPPPQPRTTYSALPQPISPENNNAAGVDHTNVKPNKLTPEQQRVQKLLGDQLAEIYEARKG